MSEHVEELKRALKAAQGRLSYCSDEYDRHMDCNRSDQSYHHALERLQNDVRRAESDCEILEAELARIERNEPPGANLSPVRP